MAKNYFRNIPDFEYVNRTKDGQFISNYTPDGNYQTYENSSMVAYEMQMSFQELEPIYHDEYTALDGDRDESIGF